MKFKGLRTVIYGVSNLEKAKNWYTDALGFKPYFENEYYIGFDVNGFELGLDPNATPIGELSAGVVGFWKVDDINEVFNHLLEIGAQEHEKPHDVGDGMMVGTVIDPFNNILGLYYSPKEK